MTVRMIVALCAALSLLVAGCSDDDGQDAAPTPELPDGVQLVSDSAAKTAEITSAHLAVQVDGTVPGIPIRTIDGDIAVQDKQTVAEGTALLLMGGATLEAAFTYFGGDLYADLGSGTKQKYPLVYDFTALLDPERGIAHLIDSITGAKTTGTETIDGTETYRVEGTVPAEALKALVPGASTGDIPIALWVSEADSTPVRAVATFATPDGATTTDAEPGKVTVTLSKVNEPVTVEPPA